MHSLDPLGLSLAGKALDAGLWSLDVIDLRDFGVDKHRTRGRYAVRRRTRDGDPT